MEEILEIVLKAIDDASSIFSSVSSSADEMGSAIQNATTDSSTGFNEVDEAATTATGSIQDIINYCQNIDGSGPRDAAAGMDELDNSTSQADAAVEDLGADLDIINAGMMLQTAEQIKQIGSNAEGMAQSMNDSAISVGQLATQTGIAEPQMVNLINTISNVTFPNDEAMMYVKSLDQIGVSSENLGASATNLDKINDAFFHNAETVNSLGQELSVLGVDMNHVETAFNALAYANANTVGGMQNYYTFLRKYDAQFKELGMNVDQASIVIAAATQKFGGGRAALSGLNEALESSNGDLRQLEQSLGLAAGSLDNASQITGQYEGQLQQLANEEMEHKTILERLGAAWEDLSLSLSGILSPLGSAMGLIGQAGGFAMQINGLVTLGGTLRGLVGTIREFNLVQSVTNALEGEGAIARIASAIGITTEAAAAEGATVAFGGLAIAEGAALWPILAIIAAIGLLVVAVYEIGKAFGWWSDVGTMLDAIWAGLQRLWSAFVNHPDVQAAIQAISSALSTLWSWIQQAGQAVLEFFGVSNSGEFDIVRALIDGLSQAWMFLTLPIRSVISVLETLWSVAGLVAEAIGGFWEDTLVPFGEWLSGIFAPVWSLIGEVINAIVPYVNTLITAFTLFANGQMDLPTLVWTVLNALWNAYTTIFSLIVGKVISWGQSIIQKGVSAATNFVTGIINKIAQLPGKVLSWLMNVVNSVRSGIQAWITTAVSKVTELINKIVNPLTELPGKVAGAVGGVAEAFAKPFNDAWKLVEPVYNQLKAAWDFVSGTGWGGDIVDEANRQLEAHQSAEGGDSAWGGDLVYSVPSSSSVDVNENLRVTLDLVNVPSQIDTDTLVSAITDKNVLRALVGNRDFQSLDAKVKGQLVNRNRRYNGV